MWKNVKWIGVPQQTLERKQIVQHDLNGRYAYFRTTFELASKGKLTIHITANSRYRLWVNETPVLSGPCKGDRYRQYFETVDLSEYLQLGKNVLAVQVLFCDSHAVPMQYHDRAPLFGVASMPTGHLLAIEGVLQDEEGTKLLSLTTGQSQWKVYLDDSFYLTSDEYTMNLGAIKENIDFEHTPHRWKNVTFDDVTWDSACEVDAVLPYDIYEKAGIYPFYPMQVREIPLLFEREHPLGQNSFSHVSIEKNNIKTFIFDAMVHTNAYLKFIFEKGKHAEVEITYAEQYESDQTESQSLIGIQDNLILDGEQITYEPFWFRTFRFIQVKITTKDEDAVFYHPQMSVTGYPLNPQTEVSSSEQWVGDLWEISVRTLQNCMGETYMDSPYYEQMQYPMDTRLQALFTYAVSRDTKLAKKALKDFHYSMLPEGLIQGKAPSAFIQVISTFSLHYIYMIKEYHEHTGDDEILTTYRTDADTILSYYHNKIGKQGLVEHLDYWQFIDWREEWDASFGKCEAAVHGPSTIINLMYAFALECGAYICENSGRPFLAEEYRNRRDTILGIIQKLCFCPVRKLFREGPSVEQFSQHAQAWAVLNHMVSQKDAQNILKQALTPSDVIPCTFSTSYELFRALEWAGIYEESKALMQQWINLLPLGYTTCPETPVNARSQCHAWSALPIYELIRAVVGIQILNPDCTEVLIEPKLYMNDIRGKYITRHGFIEFSFNKVKQQYDVRLPFGMTGTLKLPNGKTVTLN